MQSNKTSSRKPRETAVAASTGEMPEGNTPAPAKAKKARSAVAAAAPATASKAAGAATRHRKAASVASDTVEVPNNEASFNEASTALGKSAPKTMAAASGAGAATSFSDVVDSVGNATEPQTITRESIAELAHSYWLERGGEHGSHEEDWFRAEQELKLKR